MFSIKKHLILIPIILSASLFYSCDTVQSNESGTLHIKYTGIEEGEYGTVASFLIVNDTTATVNFWAYGGETPLYSTEVLTDSGWTYLMHSWCATGASSIEFKAGARKRFVTSLPNYDCTWRVILGVSIVDSEKYYTLKSDEIEFIVSQ